MCFASFVLPFEGRPCPKWIYKAYSGESAGGVGQRLSDGASDGACVGVDARGSV